MCSLAQLKNLPLALSKDSYNTIVACVRRCALNFIILTRRIRRLPLLPTSSNATFSLHYYYYGQTGYKLSDRLEIAL